MARPPKQRPGRRDVWLDNLVRRFTIKASTVKGILRIIGYTDAEGNVEEDDADHFNGVGFWGRPLDGRGEAIRLLIALGHSVVVGTRDERTRTALAGLVKVAPGESAAYGTDGSNGSVLWLRKDGTIEARAWDGTASPLATLKDLQELRDWVAAQFSTISGHTHVGVGPPVPAAPPVSPPPPTPPNPRGTTKLKGQ